MAVYRLKRVLINLMDLLFDRVSVDVRDQALTYECRPGRWMTSVTVKRPRVVMSGDMLATLIRPTVHGQQAALRPEDLSQYTDQVPQTQVKNKAETKHTKYVPR